MKAPISATLSSRLLATIKEERAKSKLESVNEKLKDAIKRKSIKVINRLHSDLQEMFNKIDQWKISPFLVKLF